MNDAVRAYQEGASLQDTAKEFSVSVYYIKKTLKANGVPLRSSAEQRHLDMLRDSRLTDAIAMYQAGHSTKCVAEAFGVHPRTVRNWLTQENIPIRRHRKKAIIPEEVARLNREGVSILELREMYGAGYEPIREALDQAGIGRNQNASKSRLPPETVALVRELTKNGMLPAQMKQDGVCTETEALRIVIADAGEYPCARCKILITDGKLCDECVRELEKELWIPWPTQRMKNPAYLTEAAE